MSIRILLPFLCFVFLSTSKNFAQEEQDTTCYFARVHILHGSVPAKGHWKDEYTMLGGLKGGHVVMELDGHVYGFNFRLPFHVFPDPYNPSGFFEKSSVAVWQEHVSDCKTTIFEIPLTPQQHRMLLSTYEARVRETPYDYAFLGMRCAASCYEMLGFVGVVPKFSRTYIIARIFFPRPLRYELHRIAHKRGWKVTHQQGSKTRIWE